MKNTKLLKESFVFSKVSPSSPQVLPSAYSTQQVVSMAPKTNTKFLRWFSDRDTKEDRKLILKIDLLIVPYALLAYWVKYLDQANLSKSSHANPQFWCI